jgi:hypothetical protein
MFSITRDFNRADLRGMAVRGSQDCCPDRNEKSKRWNHLHTITH